MADQEKWELSREEIEARLRKQNQEKKELPRSGRSSGQGVKLLYIRDYLYHHATKEHPQNANAIVLYLGNGQRCSPLSTTPIQKCANNANIGRDGVVCQSRTAHGNKHFVNVVFCDFSKRTRCVKVFRNHMEIVVVITDGDIRHSLCRLCGNELPKCLSIGLDGVSSKGYFL